MWVRPKQPHLTPEGPRQRWRREEPTGAVPAPPAHPSSTAPAEHSPEPQVLQGQREPRVDIRLPHTVGCFLGALTLV